MKIEQPILISEYIINPDNVLIIYCNRISSINITRLVDKLSTDKLNK